MPELLAHYPFTDTAYHELLDRQGGVRPHWQRLFRQLERSSPEQLRQRQALVERQIQENGVTYNVYADPKGTDRPWALDLLPNLLSAAEWQPIAAGVAQRARLLNALLADLYGEQRLLAEGLLPSELVFGHPNFLWPALGIPPGGIFLHSYAVDLARDADGRWQVLADRTQAPSGAGYALENRQIVSRALPELYRDLRVQHLAGYFRTLQETLASQAAGDGETPLVVLLTPGRFNETYFEHLYLARQLGFPLVEGHDLTVRDATLYLKTLGGLKRVHAVLRRLDDDFCDPLELRTDSALGIPGLLEAVRQERVLVANALGSGVLESPGLLGFLPQACRRLLGEELALPSLDTRCGEPQALEAIRGTARPGDQAGLSRPALRTAVRPRPRRCRPGIPRRALARAPAGLRGATPGAVVPGAGLARRRGRRRPAVAGHRHARVRRRRRRRTLLGDARRSDPRSLGGGCRGGVDATRRREQATPGYWPSVRSAASRGGRAGSACATWSARIPTCRRGWWKTCSGTAAMPSVATTTRACCGWCCRATWMPMATKRRCAAPWPWPAASACCPGWRAVGKVPVAGVARRALAGEPVRQPAAPALGGGAGAQALSGENWLALLELQRDMQALDPARTDLGEALDFLNRLVMSLAALSGFALDDMTRDDGWRFLMIGRRIERVRFFAESIAAFLDGGSAWDAGALEWLLELGNSGITYRSRYLASPHRSRCSTCSCCTSRTRTRCASSCRPWSVRWSACTRSSARHASGNSGPWANACAASIWRPWKARCSARQDSTRCSSGWRDCCATSPPAPDRSPIG